MTDPIKMYDVHIDTMRPATQADFDRSHAVAMAASEWMHRNAPKEVRADIVKLARGEITYAEFGYEHLGRSRPPAASVARPVLGGANETMFNSEHSDGQTHVKAARQDAEVAVWGTQQEGISDA